MALLEKSQLFENPCFGSGCLLKSSISVLKFFQNFEEPFYFFLFSVATSGG